MKFSTTKNSGFTMVELLAAMTILAIMVLAVAETFSAATEIFHKSRRNVVKIGDAQAAINIIAKDLEYIVSTTNFYWGKSHYNPRSPFGELSFDTIAFTTSSSYTKNSNTNNGYRSVINVKYEIDRNTGNTDDLGIARTDFSLMRKLKDFDAKEYSPLYERGQWWNNGTNGTIAATPSAEVFSETLAENVVRFKIYAYSGSNANYGENASTGNSKEREEFFSHLRGSMTDPGDQFLASPYYDIYLQVASEETFAQVVGMTDAGDVLEHLDKNSRVLIRRVFPKMRRAEEIFPISYE